MYAHAKQHGLASLVLLAFILLFSLTVNSQQRSSARQAQQHYQRGLQLLKKGDMQAAVESLRKALEIDSRFFDAHLALGSALQQMGDVDAAIVQYRQAVEIKPSVAEAHSYLAVSYTHLTLPTILRV